MSRLGRLDPPQQHFERHAGKRAAGPSAGENMVAGPAGFQVPQDGECAVGKGNAMLARGLCAGGRDRPDLSLKVEFDPTHHGAVDEALR
jgi:hypothetical protein